MIIDRDAAISIIFDRLEEHVSLLGGYSRSENFVIERIPGTITWSTFNNTSDKEIIVSDVTVTLFGKPWAKATFKKEAHMFPTDTLKVTYSLSWSGGGGGGGKVLRACPSFDELDYLELLVTAA